MKTRTPRVWRFWCGFVNGHPDAAALDRDRYGTGLYRFERKAGRGHMDVRRVEVREIPAKRKARR